MFCCAKCNLVAFNFHKMWFEVQKKRKKKNDSVGWRTETLHCMHLVLELAREMRWMIRSWNMFIIKMGSNRLRYFLLRENDCCACDWKMCVCVRCVLIFYYQGTWPIVIDWFFFFSPWEDTLIDCWFCLLEFYYVSDHTQSFKCRKTPMLIFGLEVEFELANPAWFYFLSLIWSHSLHLQNKIRVWTRKFISLHISLCTYQTC